MTHQDRVGAYVDGELDAAAARAFEAELTRDPALAAEVARQRRLKTRLAAAYAPVLDEPVPAILTAAASAANDAGRPRFGPAQWAAMAACLVVGLVAGRMAFIDRGALVSDGGALVARGDLAEALSRQLAAEPGTVRVGLSFRTAEGAYCRTFQSPADRLAGLACRQDDRWLAQTVTAWAPGETPEYRTAAADTPPAILAAVDQLIAGDPLDAAAEQAARAKNWAR